MFLCGIGLPMCSSYTFDEGAAAMGQRRGAFTVTRAEDELFPEYRRLQIEPSNPSIFCQILSFEIFTQSESIGSTTYFVKCSYSNFF